jgi:hypothetical protein
MIAAAGSRGLFYIYFGRVVDPESEFISVYLELNRVAHRSEFDNGDFRAGNNTHIKEMLPQRAFAADRSDNCGFTDTEFF